MASNPSRPRKQAPYKEQDGFAYVRVQKGSGSNLLFAVPARAAEFEQGVCAFVYRDDAKMTRVISAKRVENSVEIADYLDKCREEGIIVHFEGDGRISVQSPNTSSKWVPVVAPTLREAYHRCINS